MNNLATIWTILSITMYKENMRFWVRLFVISIIPLNKFFYNNAKKILGK